MAVTPSSLGKIPSPRQRWRKLKDKLAFWGVGLGGIGVIIAIVLIFFYLLYVVFPMFIPASLERVQQFATPGDTASATWMLAIEEQNQVASRFTDSGDIIFFEAATGNVIKQFRLPLPKSVKVTSLAGGRPSSGLVAYGLSNGQFLLVRHRYEVSYPDNQKHIEPVIEYPVGTAAMTADKQKKALTRVAVESSDDQITLIARTADGRLVMAYLQKEESLLSLGDETEDYQAATVALPPVESANHILIDSEQRTVYVATATGGINVVDIADKDNPVYVERVVVTKNDSLISSLRFLAGGISLLVGTTDGKVSQWFPVRKDNNVSLTYIRSFKSQDGVLEDIAPEQRRKGFVTANNKGVVHVFHATANRDVANQKISDKPLTHIAISPRADMLIAQDQDKQLQVWKVHNEHPEISWSVLWEKIWYESYPEPDYTWQSSSASNDFEPKFSLMPLAFGTLKAAFYAMLFAVPLSIMGAIYTAYFMSPAMRAYVKPSIEIMEALPTVILGFLAGLWLAPAVEANLPGIFTLLILLPPGVLACAWGWKRLSKHIKWHVPDGWQAAMLIPAILFIGWLAMVLSSPLEALLFRGDMKLWLSNELGLTYDQRNSLVVGLAMGVAVIPTIFSIAEDAIFSVPRHLTLGSLALGATPWQTLVRVVMLTASPGIFSAVMIGLGRAVGETMIVLMATGNTPVMDFSIFQGMRTLSANIAVEMPESEVNSSHYRVLFLAALVLFMFTFLFNTAAELIRQRLRQKYSSL